MPVYKPQWSLLNYEWAVIAQYQHNNRMYISHMVRSSHLYSFGITPYISQFIYYTLWDPVYYYNVGEKLLIPKEQRFFWIGPMRHCSDARIQTSVVPSQL